MLGLGKRGIRMILWKEGNDRWEGNPSMFSFPGERRKDALGGWGKLFSSGKGGTCQTASQGRGKSPSIGGGKKPSLRDGRRGPFFLQGKERDFPKGEVKSRGEPIIPMGKGISPQRRGGPGL